jgi:hypothetical protein
MLCRYCRLCLASLGISARFRRRGFLIWRNLPPSNTDQESRTITHNHRHPAMPPLPIENGVQVLERTSAHRGAMMSRPRRPLECTTPHMPEHLAILFQPLSQHHYNVIAWPGREPTVCVLQAGPRGCATIDDDVSTKQQPNDRMGMPPRNQETHIILRHHHTGRVNP